MTNTSTTYNSAKDSAKQHSLLAKNIERIYTDGDGHNVLALENFNLEITGAEVVGLVGPSGCGKSTFLRLVAGLDKPQAGELLFDGESIEGPHYDRGLVFQSSSLYDWLTVAGNIAFGLKARHVYKENAHKVQEYIDMMGLQGFEDSYPYQISGGMASRCALARTFIQEPGLVLLDEPLSALDAFTRMVIQDEIIRMHERTDAIFILVTHDIEEAVYLCDRVLVMSSRPGTIIGEVDVDLAHPRDRTSSAFVDKRKEILELFEVPPTKASLVESQQEEVREEIEKMGSDSD